jgi:coenzyme F420-reducing hydrogenase delta subunit
MEACSGLQDKSAAAREIMTLVEALRVQMAKDGLTDYEEFAAFRQGVSAVQRCANRLRTSFGGGGPRSHRPLKACVFYCSNNVDAGRLADLRQEAGGDTVKTIGLPCSGKVDVPYLVKALETGADGVVIVACKKEECRHFEGSRRAHKRAEAVESLLAEIGLGAGRMTVIECAQGAAGQVSDQIKQFLERVRSLPQGRTPGEAMNKPERMVA